jgi:tRNA pseudouridine38-40 synthase
MRRIAITVEYDGTEFLGWQLQARGRTVQGVVEEAIRRAAGADSRVPVHGSGRTDAGVHAAGQVAHFDTRSDLSPPTFVRAINHWLPPDVSVLHAREVPVSFHARFCASSKLYRYRILRSGVPRPLRRRYSWRVYETLDVPLMQACAKRLLGTHDFASFTSTGSSVQTTVRRILRSEWRPDGRELCYFTEADGFTYNMVRAMVGTMLQAGRGKLSVRAFEELVRARDRSQAGPTADPRGLTLVHVRYGGELLHGQTEQ